MVDQSMIDSYYQDLARRAGTNDGGYGAAWTKAANSFKSRVNTSMDSTTVYAIYNEEFNRVVSGYYTGSGGTGGGTGGGVAAAAGIGTIVLLTTGAVIAGQLSRNKSSKPKRRRRRG